MPAIGDAAPAGADNVVEYVRQLVTVPILHSSADMGTMGPALEAAYVERLGRRHWDQYLALIDGYWDAVRAGLEQLALDYRQVDLYQDGLPLCGRELEIANKAAAAGSENYQLLADLVGRGATLVGTEDPALLLKEYQDVKSALAAGASGGTGVPPVSSFAFEEARGSEQTCCRDIATGGRDARPTRGRDVRDTGTHGRDAHATTAKRDAFIGRRIGQSLAPGRTGILFLGMMHKIESFLPPDIVTIHVDLSVAETKGKI